MAWIHDTSRKRGLHRRHDRGPLLPSGGAGNDARRGHVGRGHQAERRLPRLWHSRRPRHHVRLEHGRHLSGRLSADGAGQRSARTTWWTSTATPRSSSNCTTRPALAGSAGVVRVSRAVRRLAGARPTRRRATRSSKTRCACMSRKACAAETRGANLQVCWVASHRDLSSGPVAKTRDAASWTACATEGAPEQACSLLALNCTAGWTA